MAVGRHFLVGARYTIGDCVGAQTVGDRGAIDRRIPAPMTTTFAPNLEVRCIKLAVLDVFQPIENVLFARDSQPRRCTESNAKKDCAKLFL